ncbi:MAG: hypothetical protein ACMXYD_04410 [Candidatus Woesearchaeota archaeon]
MNLHEFYTHKAYDQKTELQAITKHLTGSVLFVGDYSATLAKNYPESHAAVFNQELLFELQTTNEEDIKYAAATKQHLPYPDNTFTTIIAAYNKTHTNPRILEELKRVSKNNIILIEATTSEYTQTLQQILPKPVPDINSLYEELGEYNIIEETLTSTYTFKDKEEFSKYLQTELKEHEQENIEKEEIAKHYKPTLQEQATLLICTQ